MKATTKDTRPTQAMADETGLYSHDRTDHPHATEPGRPVCWVVRPHRQHGYGKLHQAGGFEHWCNGVAEPDPYDFDPTGGR